MSTYSKILLSGSTDGRGIKVAATSIGSGTTIHTAQSSASTPDIVTLFAINNDSTARTLTIGFGGTTSPDDLIVQTIASQTGLSLIVADLPLRNSLVIKAAGSVANMFVIFGYVNRIT